jgi:hypothetical protein
MQVDLTPYNNLPIAEPAWLTLVVDEYNAAAVSSRRAASLFGARQNSINCFPPNMLTVLELAGRLQFDDGPC